MISCICQQINSYNYLSMEYIVTKLMDHQPWYPSALGLKSSPIFCSVMLIIVFYFKQNSSAHLIYLFIYIMNMQHLDQFDNVCLPMYMYSTVMDETCTTGYIETHILLILFNNSKYFCILFYFQPTFCQASVDCCNKSFIEFSFSQNHLSSFIN